MNNYEKYFIKLIVNDGLSFSEAKIRLENDFPQIGGIGIKVAASLVRKFSNGRRISEHEWPEFAREIFEQE